MIKTPDMLFTAVSRICSVVHVHTKELKHLFSNTIHSRLITDRGIHLTFLRNAKQFQDTENEYAHRVMENISALSETVQKHPLLCEHHRELPQISSKLVREFNKVTIQVPTQRFNLEDSKFTPLIQKIVNALPTAHDDDLLHLLHSLCLWPPTRKSYTPNFKLLWNQIDFECCKRLHSWKMARKLVVSDYWFHLRLNRISQYNKSLISCLLADLNSLREHQIVQLMFFINLQRQVPQTHLKRLEEKLMHILPSISIEEIGIVCLGYFKTKSKIADARLVKAIIDRFLREMSITDNATVVAILKFLKKSMLLQEVDSYVPLLHRCVQHVPSWDVLSSVHSALLSAECHVYHPLLLKTVGDKVAKEMPSARIKDGMKLLQCLAHFNHDCNPDFHQKFFEELKKESRQSEVLLYPRDLINSSLYLAYLGIYDCDILQRVLDPRFIECAVAKSPETDHAFAEIDYCIKIECPHYAGPRLSVKQLSILNHRRGNYLTDQSGRPNTLIRLMKEVVGSLDELMGSRDNFVVRHVLPHMFSPDIVVRLSRNDKPLSELCSALPQEFILVPPKNETWACFVVGPPFSFAYKSKQITGVIGMKLRQLEKIGYKTVFIPYYDLPMSSELRNTYIRQKLQCILDACHSNVSLKL